MTKKLYYNDSHMQTFTGNVMSCRYDEKKKCYAVELDQTAFFPEGGGQYADPGILGGIRVEDVQEKEGIIFHYLKQPLKIGTATEGQIDFKERFSRMQQHSGEHIVSGIVHKHFGYDNVGFHLGEFITTLDFNGILTESSIRQIEQEANEAVAANIEIQVIYPTKEELASMEYRSKKELDGQVRIVIIPGYDICACCAPHVVRTGEIGIIKLVDAVKYKGGTRVSMLNGFRALQDYREKEASVKEISHVLSAKQEEVAQAVKRQKSETNEWREKAVHWQSQYLENMLNDLLLPEGHYCLFMHEMDKNAARRFVDKGMHKVKGVCGIFIGNNEQGYHYILGSQNIDMKNFLEDFNSHFKGKGGGSKGMVQGTVSAPETEIRSYLQSVNLQ